MANVHAIRGLVPKKHLDGSPYNGSAVKCVCLAAEATALFKGDPVIFTGTADVAGTYPSVKIALAAATNKIDGVVVGFEPLLTREPLMYRAASTLQYVLVCTDMSVIYEIEANAAIAATDVGSNIDLVATQAGDTRYGTSGWEANQASIGVGATLQCRIRGIPDRVDNALGTDNKILVSINLTSQAPNQAGI